MSHVLSFAVEYKNQLGKIVKKAFKSSINLQLCPPSSSVKVQTLQVLTSEQSKTPLFIESTDFGKFCDILVAKDSVRVLLNSEDEELNRFVATGVVTSKEEDRFGGDDIRWLKACGQNFQEHLFTECRNIKGKELWEAAWMGEEYKEITFRGSKNKLQTCTQDISIMLGNSNGDCILNFIKDTSFYNWIKSLSTTFFPGKRPEMANVGFFFSPAGNAGQNWHCDYDIPDNSSDLSLPPFITILTALDDQARITDFTANGPTCVALGNAFKDGNE